MNIYFCNVLSTFSWNRLGIRSDNNFSFNACDFCLRNITGIFPVYRKKSTIFKCILKLLEPRIQLYTRVNFTFGREKFTCYCAFAKLIYTRTTNKKLINYKIIHNNMRITSLPHWEGIFQSTWVYTRHVFSGVTRA